MYNYLPLHKSVTITFLLLTLLVTGSLSVNAQKKPTALKLDVDVDDKQLCATSLNGSQFCDYFRAYSDPASTAVQRRGARDEMIQLVRGQVDTYFKLRKDGRKTKLRWLQTLLDFLEVGASSAIAIMNGERAKGVVGAALSGFQGGRTAFNKNFEVLQTQILINKMKANRAEIFAAIVRSTRKDTAGYSWYSAKNDLRRYLFAGTFNDALDTLVDESGAGVVRAETTLRVVEQGTIFGQIAPGSLDVSRQATDILMGYRTALAADPNAAEPTKALRAILEALNQDEQIRLLLAQQKVSETSSGEAIRRAIFAVRGSLLDEGEESQVVFINQTILDVAGK